MADSKVEIQVTADAEQAKRTFADVEDAANRAMEAGAQSAQKLSKSLDGVAESAKVSAREIKVVAAGMASMAAGVAASALRNQGMEATASYAGAASSGAVQGASMMAPLGPLAMILGAAGGGALGTLKNYFDRDTIGDEQAAGVRDFAKGLEETAAAVNRAQERTDAFQKTLDALSNTSADAASREKMRADEIKARDEEIAGAEARMKGATDAMKTFAATIDGPMTKEQQEYFNQLKKDWENASRDLATARSEKKSLEGAKVEKDKPEYENNRIGNLLSGLEKSGIGFAALETNAIADKHAKGLGFYEDAGAGMESLVAPAAEAADKTTAAVEEGNDLAEKQLAVLEKIEAKTTGTAVFA